MARRALTRIRSLDSFPKRIAYLRKIDPFTFEELILETYKDRGFRIKRNERYTGDGGIDGRVYINGRLYLVQAKRYKQWIALQHVRDFSAVVRKHKAKGLFIIPGKQAKRPNKPWQAIPS